MDRNEIEDGTSNPINLMLEGDIKENMDVFNGKAYLATSSYNNNYSQKYAGSVMHLNSHVQEQLLQILVDLKAVAQSLNYL